MNEGFGCHLSFIKHRDVYSFAASLKEESIKETKKQSEHNMPETAQPFASYFANSKLGNPAQLNSF